MSELIPNRKSYLLMAVLIPSFYITEWILLITSAAGFSWLVHQGYSQKQIWIIFWVGNVLLSGGAVICNDRLNIDITLMQALRKLTECTQRKTLSLGILLEAGIFVRLLLWDGPCQLLIYFRTRLPSTTLRILLLIAASSIQMYVWTKLYFLGYDNIMELITNLEKI